MVFDVDDFDAEWYHLKFLRQPASEYRLRVNTIRGSTRHRGLNFRQG